jgi:hypothetical protein
LPRQDLYLLKVTHSFYYLEAPRAMRLKSPQYPHGLTVACGLPGRFNSV